MPLLWAEGWGCGGVFHQSRDFHTANYSVLINQHNLISCTHMQSACCGCSYAPAACRDSSGMDLSAQGRRAAEPQSHTNTHSALSSGVCITSEGCFQGDCCVLTGLHKAQPDLHELPHTQTRLTLLHLWLPTTEPTRLEKGLGGAARA